MKLTRTAVLADIAHDGEMFRSGYDGAFMCLAPEHSVDFNPATLRDLRRPTIFPSGSGTIAGLMSSLEHAPDYTALGVDTDTSFNGQGSGSSDSLPTGSTVVALSDLFNSNGPSFSGWANEQVSLR